MIFCIWYPCGGFGHFINAVLTLHGNNFVRPTKTLKFSPTGNSHDLDLVTPKYFHGQWPNEINFLENQNYCVLIDNGIDDESAAFKSIFCEPSVIRICYSDFSWPVIARTMFDKAMGSSIQVQLLVSEWDTNEAWAQREKYFLYLRDHEFRYSWKPTSDHSLYIDDMFDYSKLMSNLNLVVTVEPFDELWRSWRNANACYIDPVETANAIVQQILDKQSADISHVKDLWDQAVVYYFIWLRFGFEVPHNDYSNWFTNTQEIVTMLKDHGVNIDPN